MFARTERLLLRPGWREDAPALLAALANERVVRNLAEAPFPYTFADAEAFLSRERAPDEPACLIYLRTRGAPRLIGGIGLARRDEGHELGYWIASEYWGLGFATEAGRAVIANARDSLRLKRLVASHFIDNPASGRVLCKLGFRSTGAGRQYSRARDALVPSRAFALALTPSPAFGPPAQASAVAA